MCETQVNEATYVYCKTAQMYMFGLFFNIHSPLVCIITAFCMVYIIKAFCTLIYSIYFALGSAEEMKMCITYENMYIVFM